MVKETTCFVIIGYGKKTCYVDGKMRELDLDETYSLLIKPVFENLNISCYRAIDKNVTSSIDKVMLEGIRNADIALVDISTLNANVMWELGVRHALKPNYTIIICEKGQMNSLPFDINHFPIHQYAHSEEGIPYKEVKRFQEHLTNVVKRIQEQDPPQVDSPVHTFLGTELGMEVKGSDSFASIMDKAEIKKNEKQYNKALQLFEQAKEISSNTMTLRENISHIVARIALCTYKSKQPNELEALTNAQTILNELNPLDSLDVEVLGLSGAIYKRQSEIDNSEESLDFAIKFYEKGFHFKQDYYNGVNSSFMNYKKASLLKARGEEWEDVKLKADYIRNRVLEITLQLESELDFLNRQDMIWVLLTIAECYGYKNNIAKQSEYEEKSIKLAEETNDDFAISSYYEQKEKIGQFINEIN